MIRTAMYLVGALALLAACSDDSGPVENQNHNENQASPSHDTSSLTPSPAQFVGDHFAADLVAQVRSQDGRALAGLIVRLVSVGSHGQQTEEGSLLTDEAGQATFHVTSHSVGTSYYHLMGPDGQPLAEAQVTFTLDVSADFADTTFDASGMETQLQVSVQAPGGPAQAAKVLVDLPEERSADTLTPREGTTDASGTASFLWRTTEPGSVSATVYVLGLDTSFPIAPLALPQRILKGTVTLAEPFGQVDKPRIGLMNLNFPRMEETGIVGDPTELLSAPLDLQDGSSTYELDLPYLIPYAQAYHPEDGDVAYPDDYAHAVYALVVYDDVGSSPGRMDAGDELVAYGSNLPFLVYLMGTLPDEWENLATQNFNLAFLPEGRGARFQSWDQWAAQMNLDVTMAHVPQATLRGQVAFDGSDQSQVHVLALAVPADATGPEDILAGGASVVLDETVATTEDASFQLDLPGGVEASNWYVDLQTSLGPITVDWIRLLAYSDRNGNGTWEPGEPLCPVQTSWDVQGPVYAYVHRGFDWILNRYWPSFHSGYLAMLLPRDFLIDQVDPASGRFHVQANLDQDHANVSFRIERRGSGGNAVLLSGSDLRLDHTTGWAQTGVNLAEVAEGDWLVITEQVSDWVIQPLTTSVTLSCR